MTNSTPKKLHLAPEAYAFALRHVERYGDTDVLPSAFEFQAIRHTWEEVISYLVDLNLYEWFTRPLRKCLSPKHRLGFRIVTQLDPLDTLILTALIHEIGAHIEAARIPSRDLVVLSHRFDPAPNGRLYSKTYSYERFRTRSLELARETKGGWVVLTDIADFYHRIYTHRLENALHESLPTTYADVIANLIRQWNDRVSYGIPVGPSATDILAELVISDVDFLLLNEGVRFCRYSDDFRLFAQTQSEALRHLTTLANALFAHGLTLQESKTELLTVDEFIDRFRQTEAQRERILLEENWERVLNVLGFSDFYGHIDYEDLHPEQQYEINQLNLVDIVWAQVRNSAHIDIPLTRFALRRLAQIADVTPELVSLLLDNINKLIPVFREVIGAIAACTTSDPTTRQKLHQQIVQLLTHPSLSHLEYYRLWVLTLFQDAGTSLGSEWQRLYREHCDAFVRRELLLVMGFTRNQTWMRYNKHNLFNLGEWERRAFLRAASCLPQDEATHWFRAKRPHLDRLAKWVVTWTKDNPIANNYTSK